MKISEKVELYRQASRLVKTIKRRSINKINRENLYPSEFRVLSILKIEEGIPLSKIARRWSMQNSNITNTVNSLIERGYAVKERDEDDKRISKVWITPLGEKTKNKHFEEFEKNIGECLKNVDDRKITAALKAVNEIIEQI